MKIEAESSKLFRVRYYRKKTFGATRSTIHNSLKAHVSQ